MGSHETHKGNGITGYFGSKAASGRKELGELVFHRRLKVLEQRLDELLKWKNPNDTLKAVIKKVHRQKDNILIFIKRVDKVVRKAGILLSLGVY